MATYSISDVEQMKATKDIDGLIEVLASDKDETVRAAAATDLGEIGDAPAIDALIRAICDPSLCVRQAVAGALEKLGIYNATGISMLKTVIGMEIDTRGKWVDAMLKNREGTEVKTGKMPVRLLNNIGPNLLCLAVGAVPWAGMYWILAGPQKDAFVGSSDIVKFVEGVIIVGLIFAAANGWGWLPNKVGTNGFFIKYMTVVFMMGGMVLLGTITTIVGFILISFWTGKSILALYRSLAKTSE